MLNPNCSEAVFRLNDERYKIQTDYGEEREEFLRKMFDNPIEDPFASYEPIANEGGGADFIFIEASLCFISLWARNKINMEMEEAINFLMDKPNSEILVFLLAFRNDELVGSKIVELMHLHASIQSVLSRLFEKGEDLDLDEVIGK